ncbi:MAG: hypothetical protein ISS57_04795 [Anaerolineales bacterium]|nr:hypothetical protein [Anaerolineales bacterium]
MTNHIERITSGDQLIAMIIRDKAYPSKTTFYTPDESTMQVGHVVYPKGGRIVPHKHIPLERNIVGTAETLMVRQGKVEVELFDDAENLLVRTVLVEGDVILLLGGAHGFRMLEDAVLFEIKQGPYTGLREKEHIHDPGQ